MTGHWHAAPDRARAYPLFNTPLEVISALQPYGVPGIPACNRKEPFGDRRMGERMQPDRRLVAPSRPAPSPSPSPPPPSPSPPPPSASLPPQPATAVAQPAAALAQPAASVALAAPTVAEPAAALALAALTGRELELTLTTCYVFCN